jgi:uncharacterized phage protein (TIGR01671 family)
MFHKRIRAWHKENKTMYKVSGLDFTDEVVFLDAFMCEEFDLTDRDIEADFDEVVFMQESGLQDTAGFNVFEGDLIKFEDAIFIAMYGDFGDSVTGVNGFGWHLAGEEYTFIYQGGGEKIGNTFENSVVEK